MKLCVTSKGVAIWYLNKLYHGTLLIVNCIELFVNHIGTFAEEVEQKQQNLFLNLKIANFRNNIGLLFKVVHPLDFLVFV